jgi:hypothetical protein
MSSIHTLGWDDARAAELGQLETAHGSTLVPGRVSRVDRGALSVLTAVGPFGSARRTGSSRPTTTS